MAYLCKEDVFVFVEEEKRTGEDQSNYTGECEKTVEGKIKLILSTMPSSHASRFVCETTCFFFFFCFLFVFFFFFFFNFIIIDCDKTLYIPPGRELHIFAYNID